MYVTQPKKVRVPSRPELDAWYDEEGPLSPSPPTLSTPSFPQKKKNRPPSKKGKHLAVRAPKKGESPQKKKQRGGNDYWTQLYDSYARFFIRNSQVSNARKDMIESVFELRELYWNDTTKVDRKALILNADWLGETRDWPARLILVPFIESLAVRCQASNLSWQKIKSSEFRTAVDLWKRYFSTRPGKAKAKICASSLEVAVRAFNEMIEMDCFEQMEACKEWIYHNLGYRSYAEKDPSIQLTYEFGKFYLCSFELLPMSLLCIRFSHPI